IRLYDTATRNQRFGLGGCTGDSGAPAFDGDGPMVIGVVTWSTAPRDQEGCGGLTGVTPLLLYRDWILETARKFNSLVTPRGAMLLSLSFSFNVSLLVFYKQSPGQWRVC